MGMTRRDYYLIANSIRALHDVRGADRFTITEAACQICDRLADNNPAFDRARFMKACGVL